MAIFLLAYKEMVTMQNEQTVDLDGSSSLRASLADFTTGTVLTGI